MTHSISKNLQYSICISNSGILSDIGNDTANISDPFRKQVKIIYHVSIIKDRTSDFNI